MTSDLQVSTLSLASRVCISFVVQWTSQRRGKKVNAVRHSKSNGSVSRYCNCVLQFLPTKSSQNKETAARTFFSSDTPVDIHMAPSTSSGKKERISRSARAGIIFPVARIHRLLKAIPTAPSRVTKAASTYLASVLEYLVGKFVHR